MKRKTFSITKIQTTTTVDFTKRILSAEEQIMVKGGDDLPNARVLS